MWVEWWFWLVRMGGGGVGRCWGACGGGGRGGKCVGGAVLVFLG